MRPDIQALRAVAVIAVVLYHLWPNRFRGGYVGVDVFFVISGFLIIGGLLREAQTTGRIRLVAFWARRARRLIPASLVALLVTGIATLIWVPPAYWAQYLQEIGAAAAYVVNWLLAANAVDYLAAQNAPSPVQHFWSLSVEEQFYIAWPILIVLALLVARATSAARRSIVLIVVLAGVTLASAVFSIVATADAPASAYFATTTRAWEFGIGGVLALAVPFVGRVPVVVRGFVGWAGLAAIGVAVLRYSDETEFPGVAAWLPVIGALLVIAAGPDGVAWAPANVARLRPLQWAGDSSYSVYLWHWPLIVILPIALGRDLSTSMKLGILVASFALGWASTQLLENPIRSSPALTARGPWFATVGTVLITALVVGASVTGSVAMTVRLEAARAELVKAVEQGGSCIGSSAFGPESDCADPFIVTVLTDPALAGADIGDGVRPDDECKQLVAVAEVLACDVGDTQSPTVHLALVGDSHAGQFLEPFDAYGREHGWLITTYLKTWCAGTGARDVAAPDNSFPGGVDSCAEWGDEVLSQIAADGDIDAVVFANYTAQYATPVGYGRPIEEADFRAAWQRLEQAGKQVIVLRDTPATGGVFAPQCVAQHIRDEDPCAVPRGVAIPATDPQWEAAVASPTVAALDLTDRFCDDRDCHLVIGGLVVYFDTHHLTATFARTMAPYLGDLVADALRSDARR